MTDPRDEQPPDPLVALIAELDQARAMAPQMAKLLMGWFNAFKAEGFADPQALYLTAVQAIRNPGMPPS